MRANDKVVHDAAGSEIEQLVNQIRAWLLDPDTRPRQLRITSAMARLSNGTVGRVLAMHVESIAAQLTEERETSRIVTPG